MGHSIRAIARYLGRSHSTISREIKRNIRPHIDSYCDRYAQSCAVQRKSIPRHSRRRSDDLLVTYVTEKLQLGWSPEIISNSVKKAFPRQTTKRVHTETIYQYQWVYNDAMQGGELYRHLVRHHKKRRKQQRYGSLRGHIPNRTDISERPVVVDERRRYGDWEGDTMVGYHHQGRFVTHVERKSRYLLAARVDTGTSEAFNQASLELFHRVPERYCKTLTLDNGSENVGYEKIEKELGFKVYFAKPYASWQRGANENTNGLLRRYFPKGTDLLEVTKSELDRVVNLLNHRPRKCLNYQTPFEVFNRITSGALGT
jgi:IS30 family transposase